MFPRCRIVSLSWGKLLNSSFSQQDSQTYLLDSESWAVVDHCFWFVRSFVQLSPEDLLHWGDMWPEHHTAAVKRSITGSRVNTSSCWHAESSGGLFCFLSVSEGPVQGSDCLHIWGALSSTRQPAQPIQRWDLTFRPQQTAVWRYGGWYGCKLTGVRSEEVRRRYQYTSSIHKDKKLFKNKLHYKYCFSCFST